MKKKQKSIRNGYKQSIYVAAYQEESSQAFKAREERNKKILALSPEKIERLFSQLITKEQIK